MTHKYIYDGYEVMESDGFKTPFLSFEFRHEVIKYTLPINS